MNPNHINPKNIWKPFVVAAALAFLYAQVLLKLGADWWTDENYSHGLLVPFVIGYIIYANFDDLKNRVGKPRFGFGLAVICAALFLLFAGTLGAELFTQRISLVVMLAGIVVYFFGAKILKSLAAPFALLLLAIPIPQIVFNKIAFPLQIYASQMAISGVRLFEIPSVRKGNVIEILPSGATQIIALEVVEACSGIRSLMTLMTLALVLAYFTGSKNQMSDGEEKAFDFLKNRDFWRAVILTLSAIPIAILTNAARVTATGVLTFHYGQRAAEGIWHDLSGWLVYLAALILLILFNFILAKILNRKSASEITESKIYNQPSAVIPKNSLYFLIAVLIAGGIFISWFNQRGEAEIARKPLAEIPLQIGDWRQKGDAIRFDAQSESILRASDYTMREYVLPNGRLANLYVGYYASQRTGATYHSPQNCLPGAGWVMTEPQLVEIQMPNGASFTANKFIIENGIYKEVLIYWYQGRGRFAASEYTDKINTIRDSVLRRRSDGAMVRVMTSVGNSETEATEAAEDLAAQTAANLAAFVPD